jgi:hypothetical protein
LISIGHHLVFSLLRPHVLTLLVRNKRRFK